MQGLDEACRLLVHQRQQCPPLAGIQGRRRQHRRRDEQAVRREIFEQAEGQWKRRDGAGRGCAKSRFDHSGVRPDRLERAADHIAVGNRAGACNEVDQLPPAHRRIMAVAGRLVQYGQQTVVETH